MQSWLFYTFALALAFPGAAQVTFNSTASREIGQPKLDLPPVTNSPNLVEGRELYGPQSVALDMSANPPILYVADTNNNRVLGFKDAGAFTKGDPADLVIGQRDRFSTSAQGPGTQFSTGLNRPVAVAVDSHGNLYVADAANNRVVRYPQPFAQPAGSLLPIDLVIGQQGPNSGRSPNQGQGSASAQTLYLASNNAVYRSGLAFDGQGNLFVSDAGNNRVLRFPVGQLASNTFQPTADLVLGQFDFLSTTAVSNQGNNPAQRRKDGMSQPAGLAFDQAGRLFVCDLFNRVLMYTPPFTNGIPASRVLGGLPSLSSTQPIQSLAQLYQLYGNMLLGGYVFNSTNNFSLTNPPAGVFTIGNVPFVVDTGNHRIMRFDPPDQWPPETTSFSPFAAGVIGQADSRQHTANAGLKEPSAGSFFAPAAAAFDGADLIVADSGNNRVLALPQQGTNFAGATRVFGQIDFSYSAPNLIEGREFYFADSGSGQFFGAGVAVDTTSDPPRLYVADPGNNRILGYKDARKVSAGTIADIVIGQSGLFSAVINSPSGDPLQLTQTGLFRPSGVAVDKNGDLWVADTGNGRVLRFASPFKSSQTFGQSANLVLGQSDYFSKITDASARNMRSPYGVALTYNGSVLVSDTADNRVLYFVKPSTGDFNNGQAAFTAFGQPDFISISSGNASNRMDSPHGIATDSNDRLYVCDSGNDRVLVYTRVTTAGVDPAPTPQRLPKFNQPLGIYVSGVTGEIWVADTNNNVVDRFPIFDNLALGNSPIQQFGSSSPAAVTLDGYGNPVVAEAINRVTFYFPSVTGTNAASYFNGWLAPGMIASLFPPQGSSVQFGNQTASFNTLPNPLPLPTTLGDIQVLVDGNPAPLFYVSPTQINFQVPSATPAPGISDFQVVSQSTGQIYADSRIQMNLTSPGFFTVNAQGTGQIAALNQDNSLNSAANPATRGSVVQFYGTGQGLIPGGPADGAIAPGALPTTLPIQVIVNGPSFVDSANIEYFGLAPGFVGVWQLNVKIPDNVPPSNSIPVVITVNDNNSNAGPGGARLVTTIAV
jgi:uncharacterized protein (TIGR03437 family)